MWQGSMIFHLGFFGPGTCAAGRARRPGAPRNDTRDSDRDTRRPPLVGIAAACVLAWGVFHAAPAISGTTPAAAVDPPAAADDKGEGPAAANRQAGSAPGTEAEPSRRATPAELQQLADSVVFQRGRFVREAIGLHFDIPRGQHLLAGMDARRADTALRGENDAHLIGWMVAADKPVNAPNLRIVRLRWRHDGLVDANSASLEPAALLDAARTRPRVPRLSGSDGALLRYADAPVRDGPAFLWSEERQPDGAAKSVFDCHALRLTRKGVLELSIVGADAKVAKSCIDELRALLAGVRFEADAEYPAQTGGERRAVYSLAGLITQTQ